MAFENAAGDRRLLGFDAFGERVKRIHERFHALVLELLSDLFEVDVNCGQLLDCLFCVLEVLFKACPDAAVISICGERRRRNSVDGVGSNQLFDVISVTISRVLCAGAGPQWTLNARAFFS